jgi:hypothetical protein
LKTKALLIDVDSKIPNLALMKISQFVKAKGGEVELVRLHGKARLLPNGPFDSVWISCVFSWNRELARQCSFQYDGSEIGGSGVSLQTTLPANIEGLIPDYDLYGDDRAVGFVQRGCIRKCQFCIVPQKEGRLADNEYRPLESWVPDGFEKILLLDNEFAACPHESVVLDTVKAHKWKLSITQGYDLRCVTKEKAEHLADYKPYDLKFNERRLYCAWDYFYIEPYVRRGIETLMEAGFKGREIMVYCLVGFNTTHAQDYHRFKVLWEEYGVMPFIMRYNLRKDDPFLNAFARYINRGPAGYRNHTFRDYCEERARSLIPEAEILLRGL